MSIRHKSRQEEKQVRIIHIAIPGDRKVEEKEAGKKQYTKIYKEKLKSCGRSPKGNPVVVSTFSAIPNTLRNM